MRLKILKCEARAHCYSCRTDADWRDRVVGVREFECPHGVTADNLPDAPVPATPTPPDEDTINLAKARAAICEPCEHNKGVRLTIESGRGVENIYRVKCGLCSTCGGGVSLIGGSCKLGKWN